MGTNQIKCPSCQERFPDGKAVRAHVRIAHRRTLDDMAHDGINHLTPSFRPMKDVLWEENQMLKAEIARLREVQGGD